MHSGGKTGEGGKIRKQGEGSVKKKNKSDETVKRRSTQVEKKPEERRPRGRPKKAKVEQELKPDLCEYELIRLENIRQREELFAELHLGDAKADATPGKSTKSKKTKVSKPEKTKGSKSEKEVEAEVRKQLEKPALEGWKREVVISKVSVGAVLCSW